MLGALVRVLQDANVITGWAMKVNGIWYEGFATLEVAQKYWQDNFGKDPHIQTASMYYATTGNVMHFDYTII